MADVSDFTTWSSTAASNFPLGSTAVGTGLAPNIRQIQAEVAKWRDGTGYGILTVTSVAGSNTITGSTSPAPTLTSGQKFLLMPAATNTGAVTVNINSAGAKALRAGNSALVGGELHANIPVLFQYDGTQYQMLGPVFKQSTRTTLTSGTGTYTTPTGATRLNVRLVGAGGGGGTTGGAGGDTTFGSLTGSGGAGGTTQGGPGGAGGAASGGDINIPGGAGQGAGQNASASVLLAGGNGGNSALGGGGGGGGPGAGGSAGATNSGGGGGGDGVGAATNGRAGGGAGGYVEKLITAPAATYSYSVGAAGSAGTSGAAGAAGVIVVDEYYN